MSRSCYCKGSISAGGHHHRLTPLPAIGDLETWRGEIQQESPLWAAIRGLLAGSVPLWHLWGRAAAKFQFHFMSPPSVGFFFFPAQRLSHLWRKENDFQYFRLRKCKSSLEDDYLKSHIQAKSLFFHSFSCYPKVWGGPGCGAWRDTRTLLVPDV
jgi:hypothetical protein